MQFHFKLLHNILSTYAREHRIHTYIKILKCYICSIYIYICICTVMYSYTLRILLCTVYLLHCLDIAGIYVSDPVLDLQCDPIVCLYVA